VTDVLERIAGRRAELALLVERLRNELAEAEAELERLEIAEQVVAQFSGQDPGGTPAAAGRQPAVVPERAGSAGNGDLPGDYQRIVAVVAEGAGPVTAKAVCTALGVGTVPKRVEGMRVRLKRLVERGWLAEERPGQFTSAP
jgi:hypothetical protein